MNNQIEIKLLTKLLTNISTNDFNTVRINKDDIKGLYIYGSRLWGTDNEHSDLDYIVILSNESSVWKFYNEQIFYRESDDIDLHIMSEAYYINLINKGDELAFSAFTQEEPLIKYNYQDYYELNTETIKDAFIHKAKHSYYKARKKLKDNDVKSAYKSMYHSIRILEFGTDIFKVIKGYKENISDYDKTIYADSIDLFEDLFNRGDWDYIDSICKPMLDTAITNINLMSEKSNKLHPDKLKQIEFKGPKRFLSNMFPCIIIYNDIVFKSSEHFYQYHKFTDIDIQYKILNAEPIDTKKIARTYNHLVRKDFNDIKLNIMTKAINLKFSQNESLLHRLKDIHGDIVERNYWNDTFWGTCNGIGDNHLGKILMDTRDVNL